MNAPALKERRLITGDTFTTPEGITFVAVQPFTVRYEGEMRTYIKIPPEVAAIDTEELA